METTSPAFESTYRQILGVSFFVGAARQAVEAGCRGGLVVAPAAPALVELGRDGEYRRALLEADVVLTDSAFMVLLWNLMMGDRIRRVSGLEYLEVLLSRPEFREPGASFWVMPSVASMERNLAWLQSGGYAVREEDCYLAPRYPGGQIADGRLVELLQRRRPQHIIIGLGGGVQEKLGLYLKAHCAAPPGIHCIGAAIGFLSGDQVRIPKWADRSGLGWLFRCLSSPKRFVPRYLGALRLAPVLWRYRSRMPDAVA
jgi:UDP-N-acetyl-D-mannosaminuronic acid transferase (WecB/TagA/CpsF family)